MRLFALLAGIVLTLPTVCLEAQEPETPALPSVDLPADVERVLRDYEAAWAGSDPTGLADLFSEDGFRYAARAATYARACRDSPCLRERRRGPGT